MTVDHGDRVVVIGGGFAGLSAAVTLSFSGVPVLLLEARGQLGGRATAFVDRETSELVDNGQHVMFGCYTETLAFLRRIGAQDNVAMQPRLQLPFISADGRRSVLKCPALPAPLHLLAGVLNWNAVPLRDRLSVFLLAPALLTSGSSSPRTAPRDETVAAWLRRHGQRERLIDALWEPLAVAALNQPIHRAGAAPFLAVLARMFGRDPSAAALVLPTKPLNQMYAEPARAFLERRGGTVRTNALAKIVTDESGVCAVDVRNERIAARTVIAAVPWHALANVFVDPPPSMQATMRAAAALESMPIVTVNLWYDRVVMDDAFVGLGGRTIHWIFDKRRVFGESASHLSLVVSAAETLGSASREELIEQAAREVAEALPGARGARLLRASVVREKRATFSVAPAGPARPAPATAVRGLFLAGDWIETGLPSTIEGAVLSGRMAAAEVLRTRSLSSRQPGDQGSE